MEDQVYKQLTQTDKDLIAALFDTQVIKAIARAGNIYQQDKAVHIALSAPDMENVLLNRGNIAGARFIYDLAKHAHSKQKKEQA